MYDMLFLVFYFFFFPQNLFSVTMPKRKGRGRPKGSSVQKKFKESADAELVIPNSPSNWLKADPGFREEQEADTSMPKKKGWGRPKRSMAQNWQESVHGNLNSVIDQLNMVEVGPGCEEPEDAVMPKRNRRGRPRGSRMQNCQENSDVPVDMLGKRGLGKPRESMNQENHQQSADDLIVKPKRKGRGQTKGLKLEMKRQQSADGKLDVLIHPTKLVAVGPGRNDFITDLSLIVRKNARLNVKNWRRVPQSIKDTIVQNILSNWRLLDTDMVRKAILDEACRLYRNWRNRLHDYYLMFDTKEEALKHVPDDINDSDWQILVDHFSSPSFEIISAKNKVNKAKARMNHTAGAKSFLAVSYDARDPVTGNEPNMQTLWQLTHKRANGEWIDEASKEVNDKVAEQVNEKQCQMEDSQDEMGTIEPEIINTAFKTVVGEKSYMQGFEAGPSLSSSSVRIQQLQADFNAQKRETENARKECNEVRARLVEVESQLVEKQTEFDVRKRERENARKECNEIRARLVEVESQLEDERLKRKEIEARLLDRQNEIQEINIQVQTAIQSALSQYLPPKVEAETSSIHKKKIAELEAQLHEAEDVITDIRSELIRYRMG